MDPLEEVRDRIMEMVADPFGGQVLRDLVPRGAVVTPALPEFDAYASADRAAHDSRGFPAFIGVEQGGLLVLLVVRRDSDGSVYLHRPGDTAGVIVGPPPAGLTLADVIRGLQDRGTGEP